MKIPKSGAPSVQNKISSETAKNQPQQSAAAKRLKQSGQDLIALDLAVEKKTDIDISKKPLAVPAIYINKNARPPTWEDLIVQAKRTSEYEIEDEAGRKYTLGDVFTAGGFGAIRLLLAHDPVVDQYYIVKELALKSPHHSRNKESIPIPKHGEETFNLRPVDEKSLQNEVRAMFLAKSPLAPHAVLRTQDRDFLLLPVLDGDGLLLKAMTRGKYEQERQAAIAVLLRGARTLTNLHQNAVAHRDIKPENFLVERSGEVLLSDFGLATEGHQALKIAGTPEYMPFEALSKALLTTGIYDPFKADMWGLGATAAKFLGVNFLPDFITKIDFRTLYSSSDVQNALALHHQDFKDNWHYFFSKKNTNHWEDFDDYPHEETIMTEKFVVLHEAAPDLFLIILRLMHPEPQERPSAKEFTSYLEMLLGHSNPRARRTLHNLHRLATSDAVLHRDAFSNTIDTIYKSARRGSLINLNPENLPNKLIGNKLLRLNQRIPELLSPVMDIIKPYPQEQLSEAEFSKRIDAILATHYTNIKGILQDKKQISRQVWPERKLPFFYDRPDAYKPSWLSFEALDIKQPNWGYRQHPAPKNVFAAAHAVVLSMQDAYLAQETRLDAFSVAPAEELLLEKNLLLLEQQVEKLTLWAENRRLDWEKSVRFNIK